MHLSQCHFFRLPRRSTISTPTFRQGFDAELGACSLARACGDAGRASTPGAGALGWARRAHRLRRHFGSAALLGRDISTFAAAGRAGSARPRTVDGQRKAPAAICSSRLMGAWRYFMPLLGRQDTAADRSCRRSIAEFQLLADAS